MSERLQAVDFLQPHIQQNQVGLGPLGAMILAPNHFSFMDHFLLGCFLRRKVRFMGKSQLFKGPPAWVYMQGGVFPVRRGARDDDTFITAETILGRGGTIAMYCEGGRSRTGELQERARRGIGYLPQEASVFRKLTVEENILAILTGVGRGHRRDRPRRHRRDPRHVRAPRSRGSRHLARTAPRGA